MRANVPRDEDNTVSRELSRHCHSLLGVAGIIADQQLNTLADSIGRSDRSNERYSSCPEKQRTKNTPP